MSRTRKGWPGAGRPGAPEDLVARLVRLAGPRPRPPAGLAGEVEAVVREHWRQVVTARARRRRRWRPALAAAAVLAGAAAGVGWWLAAGGAPAPGPPVATLERSVGEVYLAAEAGAARGRLLAPGDPVSAGSRVATGADGCAAFRLAAGPALRLDAGTRMRWAAGLTVSLEQGAVYVDSAAGSGAVEVRTSLGSVREVGTRFAVRLDAAGLRVQVREGEVLLLPRSPGGPVAAAAGEEVLLTAAGDLERRPLPPWHKTWAWTLATAPPFEGRGRTLDEFLAWVGRETGWQVRFADQSLARLRGGDLLYGSPAPLPPDRAPAVVLPAFGLGYRLEEGAMIVEEGR